LSSGYLLDTSVLSVFAPDRLALDPSLSEWFRRRAETLYLSAVTVAEIEQGLCKLNRAGGLERAARLTAWLDTLLDDFADRVLAFDARVGRIAGRLSDHAVEIGRHPGFADVAIGATAAAHDLVLLTRNGRHFQPLGIAFADPLEGPF
jgi:hypothetical protein